MEPKRTAIIIILFLLALILAACNLPNRQTDTGPLSEEARVNTAAARTIAALATELASGHKVTVGVPTATAQPATSNTPAAGAVTPAPQQDIPTTTAPAHTVTPGADGTPAASDGPCNRATFVRDATIPDASIILPNSTFTKTWELKNTGSCAWTTSYAVVFAGRGSSMNGPAAQQLPAEVKPGETALVSVPLRAPGDFGEYNGYWLLRAGDGTTFGTGNNGTAPFYVEIRVAEEYSFAQQICSAQWSSGAGKLPCPGTEGDSKGCALLLENPTLENNQQQEGLGIMMAVQPVSGGYITGQFEPILIPGQSDFRATISCANGASACYIRFKLSYKVGSEPEQLLGEWNEGYEGGVTQVIKDLDALAGQNVSFIFTVIASGDPNSAKGVVFFPRIVK